MPPVLAVVNEKDKYVGVISRRSILRSKLDPSAAKVKSLMVIAPQVSPDTSLSEIARLMIASGLRQLPLFDKNKLLGFVTDELVIHAAVSGDWGSGKVEGVMTRAPHTIEANRSVGSVLGLMREFGVSHVPVIEGRSVGGDGEFAGYFGEHLLATAASDHR